MKITLLILITAISSYFISQWIESVATNKIDYFVKTDNDIDSFFIDFKTILTDKKGHIKHTLEGDELLHRDNALSTIKQPILKVHEQDKVDWKVSSQKAEIFDTQNNIKFNHNVVVLNLLTTTDKMILKTDELEFLTNTKIMRTPLPITLETANSYTTAIGMITYTKKQQILLLDKVRTTYEN